MQNTAKQNYPGSVTSYDTQQETRQAYSEYAKNYCNRTLIVQVIIENVVICIFLRHSIKQL